MPIRESGRRRRGERYRGVADSDCLTMPGAVEHGRAVAGQSRIAISKQAHRGCRRFHNSESFVGGPEGPMPSVGLEQEHRGCRRLYV
jgi:hypothetical protein